MANDMSEQKTLLELQREGAATPLSECPFCYNTTQVSETKEGLIDCYRCGTHGKTQTPTEVDLKTGELKPIERIARAQERRDIREVMKEDEHRGTPGSSSSSGPSRKKVVKRGKTRVEQDSFGGGGQRDVQKTVRLFKSRKIELIITEDCWEHLKECQVDQRHWDGTLPPVVTLLRSFLTAVKLSKLDLVERIERGKERHRLLCVLSPHEIDLLDLKVADLKREGWIVSRGDIVEAGVWEFMKC